MIIWVVEYTSVVNGWVSARHFNKWDKAIRYANKLPKHPAYSKPHVFRVDKLNWSKTNASENA
jgi:hypothetical protein